MDLGLSRFELRRAVAASLAFLRRRWAFFLVLSLGLGWLPVKLAFLLFPSKNFNATHDLLAIGAQTGMQLATSLTYFFSNAALTLAALHGRAGRSFVDVVRATASLLPAMLPVWLFAQAPQLWTILDTWYGWMDQITKAELGAVSTSQPTIYILLLIAPSIVILILYSTAAYFFSMLLPHIIYERREFAAAVGESVRIARGNRWKIFSLYLLYVVPVVSVGFISVVLASSRFGLRVASFNVTFAVAGILDALLASAWAVALAFAYLELRRAHGWLISDDVTEVFA